MNTVYIINSLEGGGAERVFTDLISMLANDRSQRGKIEVILLDKAPEVHTLPDAVEVTRIGGSGGLMQFSKLLRVLRKRRPTLIVSFLTRANIMSVVASKWLGCCSVISERSNTTGRLANRFTTLKRWLVGGVYRQADAVIAVSKGVSDCLVSEFGLSVDKVVVLNNPVDIERIGQQADDTLRLDRAIALRSEELSILAMGRLVRSKGFHDLISAYAKSGLSCGLVILGEGPERGSLMSLAEELGVADDVLFLGFVANPYALLKSAQIFVLSSHLEGFPNALLEAMALEKAVIATDCNDGPREILALDGSILTGEFRKVDCGLMVEVGDIEALAKALLRLSQDATLRSGLAANARSRVSQFSTQKFYRDYMAIVQRVCAGIA